MKALLGVTLLVFMAARGESQLRYGSNTDPAWWISGGVGLFNGDGVIDGRTQSTWDFAQGSQTQYRGTLEKGTQNQSSIGVTLAYINMPFTYTGPLACPACATVSANPGINTTAAAHLDMYTLAAMFHVGGGLGFHQDLEASAGVTNFRNLRRDSDGSALGPAQNTDASFAFGYGFGYNFSRASELFLMQDYGIALHEKDGLSNNQSNTMTMRITRAGFRMGFGNQSPVRRRR